jgi:hypothetical protein
LEGFARAPARDRRPSPVQPAMSSRRRQRPRFET